jgi:hypothetical protein
MIKGLAGDAFSATTLPPCEECQGNEEKIVRVSRERYAKLRADVEAKINRWAKSEGKMKYLSYGWLVLENLLAVVIAWTVYAVATSKFEVIVISILLAIYAHILSTGSGLGMALATIEIKSIKRFFHTLQILKRSDPGYKAIQDMKEVTKDLEPIEDSYSDAFLEDQYFEGEDAKETMKEDEAAIQKMTIRFYINGASTFLIYTLAIYKIVVVITG